MYNPDLSRIDRQIEELQRMKAAYQGIQPMPINNIINTSNSQSMFEAKFTNENPSDIFVQNKTAFINLKKRNTNNKGTRWRNERIWYNFAKR